MKLTLCCGTSNGIGGIKSFMSGFSDNWVSCTGSVTGDETSVDVGMGMASWAILKGAADTLRTLPPKLATPPPTVPLAEAGSRTSCVSITCGGMGDGAMMLLSSS